MDACVINMAESSSSSPMCYLICGNGNALHHRWERVLDRVRGLLGRVVERVLYRLTGLERGFVFVFAGFDLVFRLCRVFEDWVSDPIGDSSTSMLTKKDSMGSDLKMPFPKLYRIASA